MSSWVMYVGCTWLICEITSINLEADLISLLLSKINLKETSDFPTWIAVAFTANS